MFSKSAFYQPIIGIIPPTEDGEVIITEFSEADNIAGKIEREFSPRQIIGTREMQI